MCMTSSSAQIFFLDVENDQSLLNWFDLNFIKQEIALWKRSAKVFKLFSFASKIFWGYDRHKLAGCENWLDLLVGGGEGSWKF